MPRLASFLSQALERLPLILQTLDVSLRDCQALVLAPTRELAQYIAKAIMSLGDFMHITIRACVGGTSVREDVRAVKLWLALLVVSLT
jgi:translation initiation factor 4A